MPKYNDCGAFITGLGTSVPGHRISQDRIGMFMKRHMILDETMGRWVDRLVKQSRIDFRHSVVGDYGREPNEFSFYPASEDLEPFPQVGKRMDYYKGNAVELSRAAVLECLDESDVSAGEVTHLITVSCTGMYAPGLDIDLIQQLGLQPTVERTCINFMGCYAAFNALKVAASITAAAPEAKVLVVCVELCSLHFQKQGAGSSHLLSNMLFGDGASCVLVEHHTKKNKPSLALLNFSSDVFPEGKSEMTWDISESGFVMKLTSEVSDVLKAGVKRVFSRLLEKEGYGWNDLRHFAFHPGGPRVLGVMEETCGLTEHDNRWAYEVLRNYGNMSSATVFFILQRLWKSGALENGDLLLSAAFGPGLVCESGLMRFTV